MSSAHQLNAHIVRASAIKRTPRVMQLEGIFDIAPSKRTAEEWDVSLDLPDDWNVGLIVGPSGSGKTTLIRELWNDSIYKAPQWSADKTILDDFPKGMSIKEIADLLSSVGFSSPPNWLRPYSVLSNGEQYRVMLARALAENMPLTVVDEFTSVIDRLVAQVGSAALQKTVRKRKQQFIASTCHYDVIDWLEPDWVYEPHLNRFQAGRSLHRRPPLSFSVFRCHHSIWSIFKRFHYLNQSFNKAARCFVAFLDDRPVALQAVLPQPNAHARNLYRGHRAVCLPDYQGIGIGSALITYVASAYRGVGARIISTAASAALNHSRSKDPRWVCIGSPHMPAHRGKSSTINWTDSFRLMTTWEYIGPAMERKQATDLIYGNVIQPAP